MCNQKRLDFFLSNDSIRPGILVLINDADWELEDKELAVLGDKDRVSFISTLHGG
jgi:ubiquitin related modifier 1